MRISDWSSDVCSSDLRAFLTPEESFTESFRQLRDITGKTSVGLVVRLAHQYGISRQACVLQLEELSLAKRGTWEWFVNRGGITDDHARDVLGEQDWRPDPARGDASVLEHGGAPCRDRVMQYV